DRTVQFTGCNGGFGNVIVDGTRLEVTEGTSTMMGCMGAEGEALMEWDQWFGRLLSDGVEVKINGDAQPHVTLTGQAGSVELDLAGPIPEREPVEDPDASVSSDARPDSDSAPVSDGDSS